MASPRSPRSPSSRFSSPRQDSASSSKSISWDAEIDSDALFTNHSIEEIRVLENKTRGDIEKKKEELRLMVGERYRDLIDAADTITEMKEYTQKIKVSVEDVQHQCKELHQSHKCHGVGGSITTPSMSSQTKSGYSLAAQMKLLVDTPEKVWSALERHQYLKAAQLYLLSHHIVSILHLNAGDGTAPKVLSSFPILQRQWAAISHFKDSIIHGSRALLKDATQTDEAVAEALCSILLLEESSPRQVFSEFLLARKSTLQEIFHPSQHSTSIRSQVCELIRVIRTSLYQIHSLFICDVAGDVHEIKDNPALLFKTLHQVTKRDSVDPNSDEEALEALFGPDFDLVTSARYLPKSVLEFRPHMRAFSATIPLHNIQSNCEEWVNMCLKDVSSGVSKLLKYIGTLKGLGSIRDAVWDLLTECDASLTQEDNQLSWDVLCAKVVNHDISLWDMFMREVFLDRAKKIISGMFDATISSCQHMMSQLQDDLSDYHSNDMSVICERDISQYVWHEGPNDVPLASLWGTISSGTKQKGQDGGGLTLKARGCTPAVQRLCQTINERLTATLEDAQFFISKKPDSKPTTDNPRGSMSGYADDFITPKTEQTVKEPFDRYSDSKLIQTYLQETCFEAFSRFLTDLDKILEDHKTKISSTEYDTTNIDRILFAGRFCSSLIEQCPLIKVVMKGVEQEEQSTTTARQSTARITRQSSFSKRKTEQVNIKLNELSKLFKERYFSAFRIWKEWVCGLFLSSYEESLIHGGLLSALFSMTTWEEINIEEESETGSKVQSTIRVPMQVSSFVSSLLFSVCQELNRIGGHALDRKLLQEVVDTLSDGILSLYERLVDQQESNLPQNRALQYLFDFRFITSILAGRSEEPLQESSESYEVRKEAVVDSLEGVVDPFDLDVFTPYMATNITRQLQRCGVLYGILVSLDKHSNHSFGVTSRPSSGSQDQHNIMPLAPNPPRFTLLPLSSHHSSMHNPHIQHGVTKQHRQQTDHDTSTRNTTAFFKHHQFFDTPKTTLQAL